MAVHEGLAQPGSQFHPGLQRGAQCTSRPITFLNTLYEIITNVLNERVLISITSVSSKSGNGKEASQVAKTTYLQINACVMTH